MTEPREKRRSALLRAARDVFVTHGYQDARIEQIAAKAGVGKGTFYLYFKDKRAIYAELVDGLFQRLRAAILDVDSKGDIESQVRHNIRALIAVITEDAPFARSLMWLGAGLDPQFTGTIRGFHRDVHRVLAQALRDGQALGVVAEGDPDLFATFAIGALKEVVLQADDHATPARRELLTGALFDILQRGMLRVPSAGVPHEGGRARHR